MVIVLCSACASGGSRQQKVSVLPTFTACDVIRTFREVTGQELAYRRRLDLARMGGGVSDEVSTSGTGSSPYGEFRFWIEVERPTAPGFALRPVSGRPDSRGIYWTYDIPERPGEHGAWAASKIRRNVKLTWFNATKATDANWEMLNRVLEALRHRKSSC